MAKKPPRTRTWAISRIKGTSAAVLGHVEAPDTDSAIKEAIKKFEITDPEQQQRLRRGELSEGENRIQIYGPKSDGSYRLELRQRDGQLFVLSVPARDSAVLKHFRR